MKQLSNLGKYITTLLIGFFTSSATWAQDSISAIVDDFEIDIAIIDKGPFYAQLWFWVVLGIVFLLILILLIRGGGSRKVNSQKKEDEKDE